MDPINPRNDFFKQSLYSGMEFKSKETIFRFISLNHNTATIWFYDRQEEIPLQLFYQVLIDDNQDVFGNGNFE